MAHILIVDDERTICRSLKINLEDQGYEVTTAEHGNDAHRQILKGGQFDLILTDWDMGPSYWGGDKLVQLLRESEFTMPIILMSGSPRLDAVRDDLLKLGCTEVLPKDIKKIIPAVQRLLPLQGS